MLTGVIQDIKSIISSIVQTFTDPILYMSKKMLYKGKSAAWNAFITILIVGGFLLSSLALYVVLYWMIMPSAYQRIPIKMYSSPESKRGTLLVGEDINIGFEDYDISLHLTLPESDLNYQIGNFEANLKIGESTVLRGTGILYYRSPLVRLVYNALFFFPTVLGLIEESQYIVINFPSYSMSEYDISQLSLEIIPPKIQIYTAELVMVVRLNWIRHLMYYYPFTTGLIAITCLSLWEGMIVCIIMFVRYQKKEQQKRKSAVKVD